MRINIDITGLDSKAKRTHSSQTTTWDKLKNKYVASMTTKSLGGAAFKSLNTTVISNLGAMTNDITVQNRVDNVMSVANRAKSFGTAAWVGSALGPGGIVFGLAIEAVNQAVQAYQANTDWKIQALENKITSVIELEALGLTATDLNR